MMNLFFFFIFNYNWLRFLLLLKHLIESNLNQKKKKSFGEFAPFA